MRRFLNEWCWCWFNPGPHNLIDVKSQTESLRYTSDEEMKEIPIDTSDWESKRIENLKQNQIKEKDRTKEYSVPENERELKLKQLGCELGNDIGSGTYGRVCIAFKVGPNGKTDKTSGHEIVCKQMELKRSHFVLKDPIRMKNFKNELFELVMSNHKNIIGIMNHFIVNDWCYLLMEFANAGNMNTDLEKRGPYNEKEAMAYFAQISSGLYYLHCKLGIAHLNLKLTNFLIFGVNDYMNRNVKITDFGLNSLRIDENGVMNLRGNFPFMSPQVLILYKTKKLDYDAICGKIKPFNPYTADIWSLGVCLYLMLFKEYPFQAFNEENISHVLDDQRRKNYRSSIKYGISLSDGCHDMIDDCLEPDPYKRLTIQNIVCHYWFENDYQIQDLTGDKKKNPFQ